MTAVLTAGHSKGCTTWTMTVEGKHVVFVCSTTAPGYRLEGPIVDEFRETFRRLEAMPCDVFLAAHGSFFDLDSKRRSGSFVDPNGYRSFVARSRAAFEKQEASR